MDTLKVIIVGSGLAGSLLANGLLNQSSAPINIVVFERDDQASNRKGYQIRLGSHALTGFRACLTKVQFDALLSRFGRSGGAISSAPVMFSPQFKLLLDLRKFPAYTKSAPINRALLRDILQEPLRDTGVLHYHKKFIRYEILSDGGESRVRAYFSDGSTEEGDILIAADGSGSATNRQLGANNIVQMAKRQGFLGKSDLPLSVLRTLPKALIECGSLSCLADDMNMFASGETCR
jgi:2-polyprenyl-6-methoxyphenol hydroxylase-like FAD-dependent oxidoreductase